MKVGTRSLLFGVHQVMIHPWFVAWAWWKLYGFPWDPRLWVAFIVHDWGYWGKPNMDGTEGEKHVELGAELMGKLFDRPRWILYSTEYSNHVTWRDVTRQETRNRHWRNFCLYHSRFYAKRDDQPFSRLCVSDKLAIGLTPWWLYLPQAWLSGELSEYMEGRNARTPAGDRSAYRWYRDVQRYCTAWAHEHKDGNADTWTGTKRDLAREGVR